MAHSVSYGGYPDYEIMISDDASKFIVQDSEGRENANGKWDAADAVDYRFQRAFGPAYVFSSVVVHHHPEDAENDCERFILGPGDENVLIDDLPGDVQTLVTEELGIMLGQPVAAIDMKNPGNSRVAGTDADDSSEEDAEPLDPEKAVDIDIGGDDV